MNVILNSIGPFQDGKTTFSVSIGEKMYVFPAYVEITDLFEHKVHIFNPAREFYILTHHDSVIMMKMGQVLKDKYFGRDFSVPLLLGVLEMEN